MFDVSTYFTSVAAMATLVVLVTGWLNTHLLKLTGTKAQLLSWVVAGGLALAGQWQGIGIFAETNLLWTLLQGFGVGLVANGIYGVEIVHTLLQLVKAKHKK